MPALLFFLRDALVAERHEFPDDCEVTVRRGEGPGIAVRGNGERFEVIVGSRTISESHCVIHVANGAVSVEDRGSRNGTLLRATPGERVPLEGRALQLGTELVVREDDARWRFPAAGFARGEALCAWMNAQLAGAGLRAELAAPEAGSLPVAGESLHLVMRARGGTVDADQAQWARWCVGRYNTAHRAANGVSWTFRAVTPQRKRSLDQAQRVAGTGLPVLLVGPTGVGKDLLAQEIHEHSARREGPFVTLACAGVTSLGDVTATVAAARGGTLFLDDPAALPMGLQSHFARLLDGDHRLIATTAATAEDPAVIRPELYYRLAGVRIDVPALASADAAAIATDLLREAGVSSDEASRIAVEVAARAWPGGVRELRQEVARAMQLRRDGESLLDAWRSTDAAPSVPIPATRDPRVQPAALARLASELAFLLAARTAPDRRTLAKRTQMTYQGADQRLDALGVEIGDGAGIDAKLRATMDALRAQLKTAPALASVIRALLEE